MQPSLRKLAALALTPAMVSLYALAVRPWFLSWSRARMTTLFEGPIPGSLDQPDQNPGDHASKSVAIHTSPPKVKPLIISSARTP